MTDKLTFGLWLRQKMDAAGLNQTELAQRSKVSKQYVNLLIGDKPTSTTGKQAKPSLAIVDKLARGLGISASEARLAAGYAPKEAQSFEKQVNDEEFVALFHKFDNLPTAADKAEIKALLKMVDQQMDLKLKQKRGKSKP